MGLFSAVIDRSPIDKFGSGGNANQLVDYAQTARNRSDELWDPYSERNQLYRERSLEDAYNLSAFQDMQRTRQAARTGQQALGGFESSAQIRDQVRRQQMDLMMSQQQQATSLLGQAGQMQGQAGNMRNSLNSLYRQQQSANQQARQKAKSALLDTVGGVFGAVAGPGLGALGGKIAGKIGGTAANAASTVADTASTVASTGSNWMSNVSDAVSKAKNFSKNLNVGSLLTNAMNNSWQNTTTQNTGFSTLGTISHNYDLNNSSTDDTEEVYETLASDNDLVTNQTLGPFNPSNTNQGPINQVSTAGQGTNPHPPNSPEWFSWNQRHGVNTWESQGSSWLNQATQANPWNAQTNTSGRFYN